MLDLRRSHRAEGPALVRPLRKDLLRVIGQNRLTPLERQAALYSASGLHRTLAAFAQSRPRASESLPRGPEDPASGSQ
eukprot:9480690-Lingulodinium_polyedra.AAC.1